jgi:hypothetical protein
VNPSIIRRRFQKIQNLLDDRMNTPLEVFLLEWMEAVTEYLEEEVTK